MRIAILLVAAVHLRGAQQAPTRARAPAKAAFENATAALTRGDYSAAERGFLQILAGSPNDVGALGNLGVLYSRTGRIAEAITAYEKALRGKPDEPGILLNLGLLYFKQDDYRRARPYLEKVVRFLPANEQAARLLAASEIYDGSAASAIARLERLNQAPVKDDGVLYLLAVAYGKEKQPEKARYYLKQLMDRANPIQADFLLGRVSYDSALFDQAAEALRRVIRTQETYPGVHRELGKVLASQRDLEGASAELREAFRQDPQDSEALYFLGAVLAQQGRSPEAIPYLEQTCQRQPDSWAAFYYLGKSELAEGKSAEAIGHLRRAIALNSNDASAYYSLGRALQAAGKSEEAKAAQARVRELKAGALKSEADALSGRVIGVR